MFVRVETSVTFYLLPETPLLEEMRPVYQTTFFTHSLSTGLCFSSTDSLLPAVSSNSSISGTLLQFPHVRVEHPLRTRNVRATVSTPCICTRNRKDVCETWLCSTQEPAADGKPAR